MLLWIILSVIFIVLVFIIGPIEYYVKDHPYGYLGMTVLSIVVAATLAIFVAGILAPKYYTADETHLIQRLECKEIIITPNVETRNTTNNCDYNINYMLKGTSAALNTQVSDRQVAFYPSETGYPYIERYHPMWQNPVRNTLYGEWGLPNFYYKVYYLPDE